MMHRRWLIAAMLAIMIAPSCSPTEEGHVYVTWDTMEADRVASAWLLKRYVDPEAEFRFCAAGQPMTGGIPFDVPEAEIRRYHNLATFEYILQKYKIRDPRLTAIGRLMHEIEVITWQAELSPEADELNTLLRDASHSVRPDTAFCRCMALLDSYYDSMDEGE